VPPKLFEDEFFEKINNKKRDIYSIWAAGFSSVVHSDYLSVLLI
jgi:hypothetical protein